jgi:hypothetical protein
MKSLKSIAIFVFVLLIVQGREAAGGPFGPSQPIVRESAGLHTAVGYWFHEDRYQNDTEHVIRQNQVYSEAGYGFLHDWEIYGRVGLSDLKVIDAFSPTTASTTTSKNDFNENGKVFGTLGAKGFYPFNETFGMGAQIQATYYFSDFTDTISGTRNGVPFSGELGVKSLWDVNLGLGLQATVPYGIKMYIGPFFYYSEAKVSSSDIVAGLAFEPGETTIKNKTGVGGFSGIEVPLAKGFRLNIEGQYAERLSVGTAITYAY